MAQWKKKKAVEDCVATVQARLILKLLPPLRIICVLMSEHGIIKSLYN